MIVGRRHVGDRCPNQTTTCRETAVAGPIPAGTLPASTIGMGADSQGQQPADPRLAVPTREHQPGGAPTHALPARRAHSARPPPAVSVR